MTTTENDEHEVERDGPKPAADWIDGSKAVLWGKWRWPADVFTEIQRWGDQHSCRFLLASEFLTEGASSKQEERHYYLSLYIAPKPNRRATGLCGHSIASRDRNAEKFTAWLEGYLAGRGLLFPGEDVRRA